MHVAVLGAGALGTLFGASIWEGGGARVTLIGRRDHVLAINERGVLIRDMLRGERCVIGDGLRAVTDPSHVAGTVDYLLVAVKDRDLHVALERTRSLRSPARCVFSLQNGIEHDHQIRAVFGANGVIGALTMEGAAMPLPGVIEHVLASTTYLGEFSGARSERVEILAAALRRGGLLTEVIDDIEGAKWTKFVQSCAASGICGVSRLGYTSATGTEAGARLYVRLVKEGVAVMRAHGLEPRAQFADAARIDDISGMPEDAAVAMVHALAAELLADGYTGTTSLARDLQSGRPSEVDAIMGAMARSARRLGVDTPTLNAVYLAIKAVDEVNVRAD